MKRRFQAYCLGTGRSGTRSMAGIFASHYRASHEPHAKELLTIIPAFQKNLISKDDFKKYVIHLDNKLLLELNSSFLNNWLLDVLMVEFPDAKFILPIRDCYSWLNSFINDFISQHSRIPSEYEKFLDMVLGKGIHPYAKEEQFLKDQGLYTLDALLSYWARTNNDILNMVPASRILVMRTEEIGGKIGQMADFLDIPPQTLDATKVHLKKSMPYSNKLANLDKDFLLSRVDVHCKVLMDKFFPEFVYNVE